MFSSPAAPFLQFVDNAFVEQLLQVHQVRGIGIVGLRVTYVVKSSTPSFGRVVSGQSWVADEKGLFLHTGNGARAGTGVSRGCHTFPLADYLVYARLAGQTGNCTCLSTLCLETRRNVRLWMGKRSKSMRFLPRLSAYHGMTISNITSREPLEATSAHPRTFTGVCQWS